MIELKIQVSQAHHFWPILTRPVLGDPPNALIKLSLVLSKCVVQFEVQNSILVHISIIHSLKMDQNGV